MTEKERETAYAEEYLALSELCNEYLEYYADDRRLAMLVTIGMITAKCADIYNLDAPAGILSPGDLFKRKET
jgi:hypothetical protein